MGLNRQDKAAVIEEVAGIVANSSSIVIAEYRGLSVEAVTKLRAEARKNNVTLRVVKNTLVRRASKVRNLPDSLTSSLVRSSTASPPTRLLPPRFSSISPRTTTSSLSRAARWPTPSWMLKRQAARYDAEP